MRAPGKRRGQNSVVNAEILDNRIQNYVIHDYEFKSDDKNGDGIYIDTSSAQVKASVVLLHAIT